MFEMKLGGKFAKLTADLDKLRKGNVTGKARIFNPFDKRYERDVEKWVTDLENFLVNDFKPPRTSYLSFTISSKENIHKEGQEYQDELNELADFLYHNGDKSDKLVAELAKEKEMISKGESFYFQQIKNTPDKLIKNYLAEIIKVVELPEKSYKIVKSVGDFYQYLNTPELLQLSSFSLVFRHLSEDIPSLVDDFVKKIDKKYEINLQLNSFLKNIRSDGWSNEYSYAIKKQEKVEKILNNFANETVQDIERNLLSYEVLINLLPEFLSDVGGGQLKIFLTESYEEEIKAKIETVTNLNKSKETYQEITQYFYKLRHLAKNHIESVNKDLQNAKEVLKEDITYLLTKPEKDFVKDISSLEEFTEKIREEIKQIVESRATEKNTTCNDSSKKYQLTTDLEDKQTQIEILGEKLVDAKKAKEETEKELSKKECQIRALEEKWDRESNDLKDKLKNIPSDWKEQVDNWKEKYNRENEKLQRTEQLNKDLSQKTTTLEDNLTKAKSDFQREKEKVNSYETKLKTELVISDVANWEVAINSLKSWPEQTTLDAVNDKVTTYENGLKTIFSGETIVKDGIVTKVIPTTSELSQTITNIATWMSNAFDKLNNSQLRSELQQVKQELKSKLVEQKKQILQEFITQLELKLKGEEITSTKVIQAIKDLLGKVPGQEKPLGSENKDQENQITNLNKILFATNSQKGELEGELTKSNKENIYLTSQNSQLKSQLSQKEREKLLGIMLGVESGVVLTFVLLLMFKKKRKKPIM